MKIPSLTMAALAVLASASPSHAAGNCNTKASQVWAASPTQKLTVEALADGPSCPQAVVMIAIRNSQGDLLWFEVSRTSDIMVLSQPPAKDVKGMAALLKQWITPDGRLRQADALPEWKDGANFPEAGEFPFYPDEGTGHGDYVKMQKSQTADVLLRGRHGKPSLPGADARRNDRKSRLPVFSGVTITLRLFVISASSLPPSHPVLHIVIPAQVGIHLQCMLRRFNLGAQIKSGPTLSIANRHVSNYLLSRHQTEAAESTRLA